MIPRERISAGQWLAPWLRHQHVARYEWVARYCSGKRVLDAACANAYGSAMLLQCGARRVVGLDISFVAISEAAALHSEIPLLLGDGTRLPFQSAAFDVFVSFETIEHVRDDAAFVAEARRVVRQGGMFICSTPNRRLVNAGNSIHDAPFNPFHVREYTQSELATALETHFKVEWFGQSRYGLGYADGLRSIGRMRSAAVRLHQLRKLAGAPFETIEKHRPIALTGDFEPEVLIAVCR